MNIPIISLEIQGMRNSLKVALSEYQLQASKELSDAVDRFCTEGNVARIVEDEARKQMADVLRQEV